jgi:hypothetical protein
VKELSQVIMVKVIQVNGKIIKSMGKVNILGQMVMFILGFIIKENDKEKAK